MSAPWTGTVEFPVGAQRAYDYLVDPLNRPAWQSSLRDVVLVDPMPVHEGMRWLDVTWPGLRPVMVLTTDARPHRWVEHGSWHGVRAELSLDFADSADGCVVSVAFQFRGPRPLGPLWAALTRVARPAVVADLRRAARILA